MLKILLKPIFGAVLIVIVSATLGLTSNSLRHDGIPLIRKPLAETRRTASMEEMVILEQPKPKQRPK